MSGQPGWIWDPEWRQYYFHDAATDRCVFANGHTVPRPDRIQIPRTSFNSTSSLGAARSSAADFNQMTNPGGSGYTTSNQNSTYASLVDGLRDLDLQGPSGSSQLVHKSGPIQPQVISHNGKTLVTVQDPKSEVQTRYLTSPPEDITDPDLLKRGIRARKRLIGSTGDNDHERLFDNFKRREQPKKFFTFGKVFLILWVEPAGEQNTLVTNYEPGTHLGKFGEKVFSKVRRFIVIRECDQYCSALPITSYGQRGVGKKGVKKSDHSIVYTTKQAPQPLSPELPDRGEQSMRPQPIKIDVDDPSDKLDELSRLDYGRVHTIQHNIKVRGFGKVNPKSINALLRQFQNVWNPQPPMIEPSISVSETSSARAGARRDSHSAVASASTEHQDRRQLQEQQQSKGDENRRAESGQPRAAQVVLTQEQRVSAANAVQRLVKQGHSLERAQELVRQRALEVSQESESESSSEDKDEDVEREHQSQSSGRAKTSSARSYQSQHDPRNKAPVVQNRPAWKYFDSANTHCQASSRLCTNTKPVVESANAPSVDAWRSSQPYP